MYKGTVKWFDDISGCGILQRENGEDISIHVSVMRNWDRNILKIGETVLFDIGRGRTGLEVIFAMLPGSKTSLADNAYLGLKTAVLSQF